MEMDLFCAFEIFLSMKLYHVMVIREKYGILRQSQIFHSTLRVRIYIYNLKTETTKIKIQNTKNECETNKLINFNEKNGRHRNNNGN